MSSQRVLVILSGLLFLGLCRALRDVSDTSAELELAGVLEFHCPEMFGYYPASGNCSIYFICDHGKATPKLCDDGLVFSTILKTCDWPYNVHCNPADGNRGESSRRHLHLRLRNEDGNRIEEENSEENKEHSSLSNSRREPVFDDDSFWLGRPETSLLSVLTDDEDYIDRYHFNQHNEPKRIAPKPKNKETPKPEEKGEPWFERLDFAQPRQTSVSTIAPATSTRSNNQRGGAGWRRRVKVVARTQEADKSEEPAREGLQGRRATRVEEPTRSIESEGVAKDAALTEELNNLRRRPTADIGATPIATPRHLGSAVRRRVVRKKVSQDETSVEAPKQTSTTTARPSVTLRTSRGTPWNLERSPVSLALTSTTTAPPSTRSQEFGSFARKPVLRGVEDDLDGNNNGEEGDDAGDAHFFLNPVEISKKTSINKDEENQTIPKNAARELSNSVDDRRTSRRKPTTTTGRQPVTTTTTTTTPAPTRARTTPRMSNENIFRAFDLGFHHAVRPVSSSLGASIDPPSDALDMEYEEIDNTNDDEDENVETGAEPASEPARASNNNNSNKEIIVRYDDEEEEEVEGDTEANAKAESALPKVGRNVPASSTTATAKPSRRLTQLVGLWVNNGNDNKDEKQPQSAPVPRPASPPTIHLTHLLPKNVNSSLANFSRIPLPSFKPIPPPSLQKTLIEVKPKRQIVVEPAPKPKKKSPKTKKTMKSTSKPRTSKPTKASSAANNIPKIFHKGQYQRASRCTPDVCRLPSCRCGSTDVPGGFSPKEIPQIILLTFDDSVNDLNRAIYQRLFESEHKNPNGCPIRSTFYLSHEWTDYAQVQNLYSNGHEIASHSISHSFGEKFSKERWLAEISGQRELTALYGGVDWRDVRGMRAPFLQTGGNNMFEMLKEANFTYDSSMPVYDIDPPLWPYTFDYALGHDCMIEPCPTNSIPGLWEVGMIMWEDLRGGRCSMADGCFNPPDEQGVYDMVKANFLRHYNNNRAPFGAFFHSRWFLTEHNMNGFVRFLEEVLRQPDVYVVTNWQMLQWMRQPTPLSKIKSFEPFGCADIAKRPPACRSPHMCKVAFRQEIRTLRTCQPCPKSYPWTGNNGFQE